MEFSKGGLEFPYELKIKTYDIGPDRAMKLGCILKYQQQISEDQLVHFNLGLEKLYKEMGLAWVVTNTGVIINRMPMYDEEITLVTWSRGAKGAKFIRSYNWCSKQGERLVESTSAFVLVDVNEHKIKRPADGRLDIPSDFDKVNSVNNVGKIFLPDKSLFINMAERTVTYSLTDQNGHLNNAFYTDFITDNCTFDENRRISGFSIDFVYEAKLGDVIKVYRADGENEAYFYGEHERGLCFRAKCGFSAPK